MKYPEGAAKLVFTSKIVVAIAGLLVLTLAMIVGISTIEQMDVNTYKELVASSEAGDVPVESITVTGKQYRQKVSKQALFSETEGRRQFRLVSDESDLVFSYIGGKSSAVEYFRGVSCDEQEELYYTLPDGRELKKSSKGLKLRQGGNLWVDDGTEELSPMQRVRHIDAETATYFYCKDLFAAEHVNLSRYFIPDHKLPQFIEEVSPMMQGQAKAVQFSVVGKDTAFRAHHLTMTLYTQEGLL